MPRLPRRRLRLRPGFGSLGAGELVEVAHAAIQHRLEICGSVLGPFFGLYATTGSFTKRRIMLSSGIVRALELGRVMNRRRSGTARCTGRSTCTSRCRCRSASSPCRLVSLSFFGVDDDAIDRAGALARQASGADLQIHFEDAAIAERQRVLHPRSACGRDTGRCTACARSASTVTAMPSKMVLHRVLDVAEIAVAALIASLTIAGSRVS